MKENKKDIQINLKVSREEKKIMERVAKRERRSLSNLIVSEILKKDEEYKKLEKDYKI